MQELWVHKTVLKKTITKLFEEGHPLGKDLYSEYYNIYELKVMRDGLRDYEEEKSFIDNIVKNGGKYEWSVVDGEIIPQEPPRGFDCICESITKQSFDKGYKDTSFPGSLTKVMTKE